MISKARRVIVWQADLDCDPSTAIRLSEYLSSDELERANRFRFTKDRNLFVKGRGILRQLIGNYLGMSPEEVRFEYGEHGKPELEKQYRSLNFNVSHSGPVALFAFAIGRRVGVDVERIDDRIEAKKLTRFILPGHDTKTSNDFFREWTRREAIGKAAGVGLSGVVGRDNSVEIADLKRRFWTKELIVPGDHVASLAVEGPVSIIEQKQWPEN